MKTQALRRRRPNLALLRTQARCVWVAVCVFVRWEGGLQWCSGKQLFHGQLTGAGIKTSCRNLFLVYSLRSAVTLWGADIGGFPRPGKENKKRGKNIWHNTPLVPLRGTGTQSSPSFSLFVFFPCPVDCSVSGRGRNKLLKPHKSEGSMRNLARPYWKACRWCQKPVRDLKNPQRERPGRSSELKFHEKLARMLQF